MTSYKTMGTSLFASAANGLKSTYYYLLQDGKGLTMDNIMNQKTDDKMHSYMNYNFSSYLASNFGKFDTNGDGIISEKEMGEYSMKMNMSGLTYNELVQLNAQNGSNSLLEKVLENFADIDANGDGRVTSGEIAAYQVGKDKEEAEDKYPKIDPNKISVFYDSSSKTAEAQNKKTS